jgi:transcriptional regulator with XRE-family HTH domain
MPSKPTAGVEDSSPRYFSSKSISARFGVRLRKMRTDNNWTQHHMAGHFGIDRTFISDVERGRKSMSLPMLEVVALGMKISLSDLMRDL